MRCYPGHPRPQPFQTQANSLSQLNAQLDISLREGRTLVQIDAATFSPKKYNWRAWAHQREPLPMRHRWPSGRYVAVYAAITKERGLLTYESKDGEAFTAEGICRFLDAIRRELPKPQLSITESLMRLQRLKIWSF